MCIASGLLLLICTASNGHARYSHLPRSIPCDSLFRGVHSMPCFVWRDNMVLMSTSVRDAMRMVRAASSGDELDV